MQPVVPIEVLGSGLVQIPAWLCDDDIRFDGLRFVIDLLHGCDNFVSVIHRLSLKFVKERG